MYGRDERKLSTNSKNEKYNTINVQTKATDTYGTNPLPKVMFILWDRGSIYYVIK